jgi:Flp pilus assembly protein TadD
VIGRSEVLVAFWYLATLDLFLAGGMRRHGRAVPWIGAVVCCALGMVTKPVMVSAPLAAMWASRLLRHRHARDAAGDPPDATTAIAPPARTAAPLLGFAATWSVLAYLVRTRSNPGAGLDIDISPLRYFLTQLGVTWHYLRLLVWPAGQTLEYDWPVATNPCSSTVLVPALAWIVVLGALAWVIRRRRPAAAFWLGFALLTLAPSSTFVPIADVAVEHRMYLPVAGFAVLTALAGATLARAVPLVAAGAGAVAVLALGVTTMQRNEVWRDPIALWEDALAKAPTKVRVFRNLEHAYEQRGDHANAERVADGEMRALERLRAARPHDADVLTALGNDYARRGRFADGLDLLAEAVHAAPEDVVARAAYGSLLLQASRTDEAIVQLEMAEALATEQADWVARDVLRTIRTNLGWAYAGVGREQDAVRILRLAAADGDVSALNNLGSILGRLGRWDDARAVLERARATDPGDPNVQSNLGWVYANLGRLKEAAAMLEAAIITQPQEPSAHANLAWVRVRTGDPAGALNALTIAAELQPTNAWIANLQGIAYAQLAEWDAAIAAFSRAHALAPDDPLPEANRLRAEQHEAPTLPGGTS